MKCHHVLTSYAYIVDNISYENYKKHIARIILYIL